MNILMVASEYAPLAKTGGLADATAGLSRALCRAGHDVRVLLPYYRSVSATAGATHPLPDGSTLAQTQHGDGRPHVYLHDVPGLATTTELYTGDARDAHRFIALALAAAEFRHATQWQPDVYHCHDWHAALVPDALALAGGEERAATILTLHNVGYQGDFPRSVFASPSHRPLAERVVAAGHPRVNILMAGVRAASRLTTVSPTYAREVLTPEFGMGLETALVERRGELSGILNGVDYGTWDPRHDPHLVHHYSRAGSGEKHEIKKALCRRLHIDAARGQPVVGVVSRLAAQKGIDILAAAMRPLLATTDCAFALLGSGEPALESQLQDLATDHPGRVSFTSGYNELIAHEIIAGADFLVVPSRYEPCGLTQLYALRFGTIPIVRATGGLVDTVEHFDAATGRGNGCVFSDPDPAAIVRAVTTALQWFRAPADWLQLQTNAMQADHSWDQRVEDYVAVYESAHRRP
jgi:starch synthase